MRPARLVLAACISATLLLGACGDENPQVKAADSRKVGVLDVTGVPGTMKGLSVVKEDIAKSVKNAERPYFDAVTLYSLRDGDQLEATLQLGRFADGTPYGKRGFRQSLLATIGGGTAKELRMGEDHVFLTSGDRQSIAVWFRGEYVFILSSREDYRFPRALLREALAVKP